MLDKLFAVVMAVTLAVFCFGCDSRTTAPTETETTGLVIFTEEETAQTAVSEPPTESPTETDEITEEETEEETTEAAAEPLSESESAVTEELPEDEPLPASVEKDGSYTTPEDVAEYIHTFGTLPGNYITKKEARALGWDSSSGNLWEVAPGKSIGGDSFGNREKLLPKGNYTECDVNYNGGYRGAERLIFGTDGSIYYTNDHYKTFEQLY